MTKVKWSWVIGVLVVCAIVAGYYRFQNQSQPQTLIGQVAEISQDGQSFIVNGFFVSTSNPPNQNTTQDISVTVNGDTKFVDTVMHRPSQADLAKTNGAWDMKTVKKEVVSGKISDLTKGKAVTITGTGSFWRNGSITASQVIYGSIVN